MNNRQLLIITTLGTLVVPLLSVPIHIVLGLSPVGPLRSLVASVATGAFIWTWELLGWRGRLWVEIPLYTFLVWFMNVNSPAHLHGLIYLVPVVAVLNRNRLATYYAVLLGIAALSVGVLNDPNLHHQTVDSISYIIVLLAMSVVYHMLIDLLNRQDEAVTSSLMKLSQQMANQWALTVEIRSPYTGGHVQRVTEYALSLAAQIPDLDMDLESFRLACILHDVGKIAVPDAILDKPGALSAKEFAVIHTHPVVGYDLVIQTGASPEVAAVVYAHHERWDGKGYPAGLAGEAIPKAARVLAVADAFDAMTSDRPYRPAFLPRQAAQEIIRGSGTQFDPEVVKHFQQVYPEWIAIHGRWEAESEQVAAWKRQAE